MLKPEQIRNASDRELEELIAHIREICAVNDRQQAEIARLNRQVEEQQAEIARLQAQIKELENRLALNSGNSSKPPSSDAPGKRQRSLRSASGKKSGGQKGHPGSTLKPSATPDRIVTHAPATCTGCGKSLEKVDGQETDDRRQVFDIPPVKLEVTEPRLVEKACPCCGNLNRGEFPAGVAPGAQYGDGIKSWAVYLTGYQLLPWQRTSEMLGDFVGQPISEGTLAAAINTCAAGLAEPEKGIKQEISHAPVAHFDESGLYVAGARNWLHVAGAAQLTHYAAHPKRGAEATKEIGILPKFNGRAIHDHFSSYFKYECEHGLCNAHHLRELKFIKEQMNQDWAGEMMTLLVNIKDAVAQAKALGQSSLPAPQTVKFDQAYDRLLSAGLALPENQPSPPSGKRGRTKQNKAKNLLDRLAKHKPETLAFMRDFTVPFDNNQAERDIRMIKVKQKISGCFRTTGGAEAFCRIRSYISSMKKQGRPVLAALRSVFSGQPISPLPTG